MEDDSRRRLHVHLVWRRKPTEAQVSARKAEQEERPWESWPAEGDVDPAWTLFVSRRVQDALRESGLDVEWHGAPPAGYPLY